MQQAETSTLDAVKESQKPKVTKLIEISVDDNQMVYVNWPTDKKELCISALCESLKLVSSFQPPEPKIIKPKFTDFLRGVKP